MVVHITLFFILLQACMGKRLLSDSGETSSKTLFSQCNPFSVAKHGVTICERYFEQFPTGACNINLKKHGACAGTLPAGLEFMRDLCPSECSKEIVDPESEDFDELAVDNFVKFLASGETRRRLTLYNAQCNEGYYDITAGNAAWWACGHHCPGGTYWTDTVCNCACQPIPSPDVATLTADGFGGCTGGPWIKIGTASNLDDALALMLADDWCSMDGSMLFYSHYSYDESWSVRCTGPWDHQNCGEHNPNWQEYILNNPNHPQGHRLVPCYTVTLTTATWANEITWALGNCASESLGSYSNHGTYNRECCFRRGTEVELTCMDSYGDGWHGGYISIGDDSRKYCLGFHHGSRYTETVTL